MGNFEQQLIDGMPKLRGFIFKLVRDEQLVDDILQSTLLNAWRGRDTFKGDCKLTTWLYKIARNAFLLHCRKDMSNCHVDGLDAINIKSSFDPFQTVLCGDMIEACASTRELSRGEKIIILRRMIGASIRDISVELRMGEGAIKSAYRRAKGKLKKEPIFAHS